MYYILYTYIYIYINSYTLKKYNQRFNDDNKNRHIKE